MSSKDSSETSGTLWPTTTRRPPHWPKSSQSSSVWNPRRILMRWILEPTKTALSGTELVELIRGYLSAASSVMWEGLPGWQTRFRVALQRLDSSTWELTVTLWPQPVAE